MRRTDPSSMSAKRAASRWGLALVSGTVCLGFGFGLARSDEPKTNVKTDEVCCEKSATDPTAIARGREIFLREWIAGDPRSHGGDGLGPVYNDSSCIACHNMGAAGGGGPNSKNIDILSASLVTAQGQPQPPQTPGAVNPAKPKADIEPLAAFHSGFRNGKTVVLHRFGTDPNYEAWRQRVSTLNTNNNPQMAFGNFQQFLNVDQQIVPPRVPTVPVAVGVEEIVETQVLEAQVREEIVLTRQVEGRMLAAQNVVFTNPSAQAMFGQFVVRKSQRNPSALFGIGLIDRIPEKAIVANAEKTHADFPEIKGRPSRTKDGRIGRLGWKGQIAGVEDFVLNACANEVGLEVPEHHQALIPQAPEYKAGGLDLTRGQCDDLIAYVRALSPPVQREAGSPLEADMLKEGKTLLASVGCANCHTPKLGDVEGIYSDLLLHDMGPQLADAGSYGDDGSDPSDGDDDPFGPAGGQAVAANEGQTAIPTATPVADVQQPQVPTKVVIGNQTRRLPKGATRAEWRTPPLWGFRDSGPYLHDGRADTLDQAIAQHNGQAARSSQKFFELSPKDRAKIEVYLKSLVAPATELARAEK